MYFLSENDLRTLFCRKYNQRTIFCCKNDSSTLVLLQKQFVQTFFVTKAIYALVLPQKEFTHTFFVAKTIYTFFCRENDLRTLSGKFLGVESCHLDSSEFLGLCLPPRKTCCPTPPHKPTYIFLRKTLFHLNDEKTRPSVNYAKDWLDHSFLFPGPV